jgi:formylmethanofuran dehydrogenase subunit E
MVRTAKEWSDIFAKIAEADPDEKVWVYCYTSDEIEINNPNGKGVEKADWERIVENIGSDYAYDSLSETFNEAVNDQLTNYRCDSCYEYDYSARTEDNETTCQGCGEETDLLNK